MKHWKNFAFLRNFLIHLNVWRSSLFIIKSHKPKIIFDMNIFDEDFLEIQKPGWETVKISVSERVDSFGYYVETMEQVVSRLTWIPFNMHKTP